MAGGHRLHRGRLQAGYRPGPVRLLRRRRRQPHCRNHPPPGSAQHGRLRREHPLPDRPDRFDYLGPVRQPADRKHSEKPAAPPHFPGFERQRADRKHSERPAEHSHFPGFERQRVDRNPPLRVGRYDRFDDVGRIRQSSDRRPPLRVGRFDRFDDVGRIRQPADRGDPRLLE